MNAARLYSVQVGRIAPLGPRAVPSAIIKSQIHGPVAVTSLGLVGDEQADLTVHGGPEKAVYAYAAAHYPAWVADHPQHAALFVAGGVGENLTIDGWVERWLALGPDAAAMDRVNPAYVPRNHLVEQALAAGTEGDLEPLGRLLDAVTRPYEERPGLERYAVGAPDSFGSYQTFCGI